MQGSGHQKRRLLVMRCYLYAATVVGLASAFTQLPERTAATWQPSVGVLRHSVSACGTRRRLLLMRRKAHILNTAFEWLAVERAMDEPYGTFDWINPADPDTELPSTPLDETMPLYPVPATHLPSTVNHTVNNVETRNIRMTEDLLQSDDRRFCVVLRASDTGRLASVGTVMRIFNVSRTEQSGVVRRIVVTCQAAGLARIARIENPHVAKPETRLLDPSAYLKARVRSRILQPCESENEANEIVARIVDDYRVVRSLYLNGDGARDLPPFAVKHLSSALPEWDVDDFASEEGFWDAAQLWQTLCYTIREQRQMILSADRNEFMVAAACKKGGPLKLPIHVEDLTPEDRYQLVEMEVQAQSDFVQLGLDPCLDFQNLVCMDRRIDQLKFLSKMVRRERCRLETLSVEPIESTRKVDEESSRRGAWFEGFE